MKKNKIIKHILFIKQSFKKHFIKLDLFNLKINLIILFAVFFVNCNSNNERTSNTIIDNQVQPVKIFKSMNFNNGNYTLYLLNLEGRKDILLSDTFAHVNYYTDNIDLLNYIKDSWTLHESPTYECNYQYVMFISRNDIIQQKMFINYNCNELLVDSKSYYIDTLALRNLFQNMDTLYTFKYIFTSIESAKRILNKIDSNKIVLKEITKKEWMKYNEILLFNYDGSKKFNKQKIKLFIIQQIKNRFPCSDFYIEIPNAYINKKTLIFQYEVVLFCNNDLYNKFDLYKIENKNVNIELILYSKFKYIFKE